MDCHDFQCELNAVVQLIFGDKSKATAVSVSVQDGDDDKVFFNKVDGVPWCSNDVMTKIVSRKTSQLRPGELVNSSTPGQTLVCCIRVGLKLDVAASQLVPTPCLQAMACFKFC